jgi:hypothetical protein
MDRWKAHLQERADRDREVAEERQIASQQQIAGAVSPLPLPSATVSAPSAGVARMHPTPVPTAGELFNRPDPLRRGRFVKPHSREEDAPEPEYRTRRMRVSPRDYRRVDKPAQAGAWMEARQAVPASGDDFASVPLFSPFKYRVPVTSVTRKQGDCKLFLCCGWRWTAVSRAAPKPPLVSCKPPCAHSHRIGPTTCSPTGAMDLGAQPGVLPRAHGHDLRHLPLRLLAPRPGSDGPDQARDDPDLPHPQHPDAAHARHQPVALVRGLEPHLARAQLGPLPARQRPAHQPGDADRRLLRHLGRLPLLRVRRGRLRALVRALQALEQARGHARPLTRSRLRLCDVQVVLVLAVRVLSNRPCAQTALTPTPVRRQANGRRLPLVALGGGAPRAPTAAVASNRARTHPRPGCPPVLHLGLAHGHGAGHRARHPRAEHGDLQAN